MPWKIKNTSAAEIAPDWLQPLSLPNIRFLRVGASFITMVQTSEVKQGGDFSGAVYRA